MHGVFVLEAVYAEKMGRRERNKLANRQAILDAGLKVFATIGYDSSTISDIVKESGLSVGTFYNYYGDKDSVFAELIENLLGRTRTVLSDARSNAATFESFMSDAFQACARIMFENEDMKRLITNNTHAFRQFVFGGDNIHGVFSEMEADINLAIEQGLMPAFPVRQAVLAMMGATSEVLAADAQNDSMSYQEKAQFLADIFVGGIRYIDQKNR